MGGAADFAHDIPVLHSVQECHRHSPWGMSSNHKPRLSLSLMLVCLHLGMSTGGCELQGQRAFAALLPLHMQLDAGLRLRGGGKPDTRSGIKALRSKESEDARKHLRAKKKADAAQKKMKKKVIVPLVPLFHRMPRPPYVYQFMPMHESDGDGRAHG